MRGVSCALRQVNLNWTVGGRPPVELGPREYVNARALAGELVRVPPGPTRPDENVGFLATPDGIGYVGMVQGRRGLEFQDGWPMLQSNIDELNVSAFSEETAKSTAEVKRGYIEVQKDLHDGYHSLPKSVRRICELITHLVEYLWNVANFGWDVAIKLLDRVIAFFNPDLPIWSTDQRAPTYEEVLRAWAAHPEMVQPTLTRRKTTTVTLPADRIHRAMTLGVSAFASFRWIQGNGNHADLLMALAAGNNLLENRQWTANVLYNGTLYGLQYGAEAAGVGGLPVRAVLWLAASPPVRNFVMGTGHAQWVVQKTESVAKQVKDRGVGTMQKAMKPYCIRLVCKAVLPALNQVGGKVEVGVAGGYMLLPLLRKSIHGTGNMLAGSVAEGIFSAWVSGPIFKSCQFRFLGALGGGLSQFAVMQYTSSLYPVVGPAFAAVHFVAQGGNKQETRALAFRAAGAGAFLYTGNVGTAYAVQGSLQWWHDTLENLYYLRRDVHQEMAPVLLARRDRGEPRPPSAIVRQEGIADESAGAPESLDEINLRKDEQVLREELTHIRRANAGLGRPSSGAIAAVRKTRAAIANLLSNVPHVEYEGHCVYAGAMF